MLNDRYAAEGEIARATRRGEIDPVAGKTCERCKAAPAAHRHHEDYSRPLEVVYLCLPCHRARHKELGWGTGGRKKATEKRKIVAISLSPFLLETAKRRAAEESRSFSNYIVTLIERDVRQPRQKAA